MSRGHALGAALTVLLFGAAALAQQRQDHQRRGRQEQGQGQHQPAARKGGAHRGRTAENPPQQVQRTPQQRATQEAEQRQAWQHHRLPEGQMPGNWGERGGYRGGQIPATVYRNHFGYQHKFRVYGLPFQIVANAPRFQSNGYWFELAGPVPAYWGPNWYEDDDVYIVYAYGGYYLDNASFPNRPGVAVSVIF